MDQLMVSAGGLHALAYCERLFYLENVECVRLADERVFAGRRAHEETLPNEEGTWCRLRYESDRLGLRGEVDVLRRVDGALVPYELKRGRSAGKKGRREAWQTDQLQVGAYALLAEEQFGQSITEGRVRYLADHATIRVPIDARLRSDVLQAIERARALSCCEQRPAVTPDENRCIRCSLSAACLPEEARLAADPKWRAIRLLPVHPHGTPVHVLESGAKVGRSDDSLKVTLRDGSSETLPIGDVGTVILHGHAQITTQAIRLCAEREIPVHWVTAAGGLVASLAASVPTAQRHLRQFKAFQSESTCLQLAQSLIRCKIEAQLRFLLRATRGSRCSEVQCGTKEVRSMLRQIGATSSFDELRGVEGAGARAYFATLPFLIADQVPPELRPMNRTRQPAKDRFSALLNYGYGMLYRQVLTAILAVGLHPGLGFFHRPRSSAQSLALDLMELFRVALVDMPVVAAINRKTFDANADFQAIGEGISLGEIGRKKLITVIERRLGECWWHTAVRYSLSYSRIIELEVRLLEKEWSDEPGLFAKMRIR